MNPITILVGFADTDAQSVPQVSVDGGKHWIPVDADDNAQWESFSSADRLHVFPKGIKHLKICRTEEMNCAIFISDDVAKDAQRAEKARREAEEKAIAEREKQQKEERDFRTKLRSKAATPAPSGNKLFGTKSKAATPSEPTVKHQTGEK